MNAHLVGLWAMLTRQVHARVGKQWKPHETSGPSVIGSLPDLPIDLVCTTRSGQICLREKEGWKIILELSVPRCWGWTDVALSP